jgi:hypothetical protein
MTSKQTSISGWVAQRFGRLLGFAAPPRAQAASEPVPPPEASAPPVAADPLGDLIASATASADYVFAITAETVANPPNTPLLAAYSATTTPEGHTVFRLAGGDPAAVSTGRTTGYSIQVTDELEAQASGNQVRVRVVARSLDAAPKSRFAIAYSTNEVGNTGWRWHAALPEWSVFELEYAVPPMKAGRGDFIGLLPDIEGAPGLEVAAVCAHVLRVAAEPSAPH